MGRENEQYLKCRYGDCECRVNIFLRRSPQIQNEPMGASFYLYFYYGYPQQVPLTVCIILFGFKIRELSIVRPETVFDTYVSLLLSRASSLTI